MPQPHSDDPIVSHKGPITLRVRPDDSRFQVTVSNASHHSATVKFKILYWCHEYRYTRKGCSRIGPQTISATVPVGPRSKKTFLLKSRHGAKVDDPLVSIREVVLHGLQTNRSEAPPGGGD